MTDSEREKIKDDILAALGDNPIAFDDATIERVTRVIVDAKKRVVHVCGEGYFIRQMEPIKITIRLDA